MSIDYQSTYTVRFNRRIAEARKFPTTEQEEESPPSEVSPVGSMFMPPDVSMFESLQGGRTMKFLRMISTPPMRTDQIIRYSGTRQADPESLAIHLIDVQMMGYAMLKRMNNEYGETLDVGLYLEKALIHDMDEVLTGDMPRSTKYYNETILQEMKKVGEDAMRQVAENFFNDDEVFNVWEDSKSGKEGVLVKIVDMLSVASKVLKEIELLNNNYFLKVAYEVSQYLLDIADYLENKSPFNKQATLYLIEIVMEAHREISRLWQERKHLAYRYGILENIFQGKGVEKRGISNGA